MQKRTIWSVIVMGFGSYTYMPIPMSMALAWFFGSWIKAIAAGASSER